MDQQLEEIRDQQKNSWNKFSPGWKKWDSMTMDFLRPMGDEIIKMINPKETDVILDIASGTGEPGLTIAQMVKKGKVVITDLAEDMLMIAREKAKLMDISNIETVQCDVSEMPFADNSFDAVSCRFGFMFFPDMLLAAKEMARVLKPGGRIATSVWNIPEKNFWVTASMSTINRNMEVPAPPTGSPGMFRCAKPGVMKDIFEQAGIKNITEKEITTKLKCGSAQTYWDFMTEVAAPVAAALGKADDAMKNKIKKEVIEIINQRYPDGIVEIEGDGIVLQGEK